MAESQNNLEEIPLDSLASKSGVEEIPLDSLSGKPEANDWESMEGPGLVAQAGQYVLDKVGKASKAVDSVTAGPVRAAVGSMMDMKTPRESMAEYGKHFANPGLEGPSGKDLAAKAGVSTEEFDTPLTLNPFTGEKFKVSPAGIAGAGVDVALDPTTYLTAGLGGAIEKGAAATVGKVAPKLEGYLSKKAAERAVKAATGNSVSGIRKLGKVTKNTDYEKAAENLLKSGSEMLKPDEAGNRVVGWFDSPENIAPKAAAKADEYGNKISQVGKTVDEKVPEGAISSWEIAKDIQDYKNNLPMGNTATENLKKRLDDEIALLKDRGNITFSEAQQIKNSFKYKPTDPDALISNQDVTNDINRMISGRMEEAADKAGVLPDYKEAKTGYGSMLGAEQAASDRSVKNLANRFVSPSDYGAGATGVIAAGQKGADVAGVGLTGMAAAAANKLLRERGSSFAANSLRKLAEVAKSAPEFLGKYQTVLERAASEGARSLAITHQLLMNNDPTYKKLFEEKFKE